MKLMLQIAGGILLAPVLLVAVFVTLGMAATNPVGWLFVAAIVIVAWRLGPIRR